MWRRRRATDSIYWATSHASPKREKAPDRLPLRSDRRSKTDDEEPDCGKQEQQPRLLAGYAYLPITLLPISQTCMDNGMEILWDCYPIYQRKDADGIQ